MDFIEDHVINNRFVKEELKLKLLGAPEMAPYSYIGALFHFASQIEDSSSNHSNDHDGDSKQPSANNSIIDRQEDECEEDI